MLYLMLFALFIISSCSVVNSKYARIDKLMKSYVDAKLFNGVILVEEDGNVLKKAYGYSDFDKKIKNTVQTKFRIGSVTKQFTSMLILQQVQKGKLNLKHSIHDYLPEYPAKTGKKITLHHLLTHTSGIPNYTALPNFFKTFGKTKSKPEDIMKFFWNENLDFEPGSTISYSNSGYLLLGIILERVTGKPYNLLLKDNILNPLEMNNTDHNVDIEHVENHAIGYQANGLDVIPIPYYSSSIAFAAGAMYSTIEDLQKWNMALTNHSLLSEELTEKMFIAHQGTFGYGWVNEIKTFDDEKMNLIYHTGSIPGFTSVNCRIPEKDRTIIILNNAYDIKLEDMYGKINKILQDLPVEYNMISLAMLIDGKNHNELSEIIKKQYKPLKVSESELNTLAYSYLKHKKIDHAFVTADVNRQMNPESANVYDTLGDIYIAKNNKEHAIKMYQKAIEIDPNFTSSISNLEKLGVSIAQKETHQLSVPTKTLEKYIGKYKFPTGFHLTVSLENNELFGFIPGQPKSQLYPQSETEFQVKAGNNVYFKFKETSVEMRIDGNTMIGKKL